MIDGCTEGMEGDPVGVMESASVEFGDGCVVRRDIPTGWVDGDTVCEKGMIDGCAEGMEGDTAGVMECASVGFGDGCVVGRYIPTGWVDGDTVGITEGLSIG